MSEVSIRSIIPHIGMAGLMVLTSLLTIALIMPFANAGLSVFDEPDSLINPFYFLFIMLVLTAVLLLLIKWKAQIVISALIGLSLALVIYYVVSSLCISFVPSLPAGILGIVAAAAVLLLLWYRPEWYIIDTAGIVVSAGCATIFGISLTVIPVLILLVLLLVYDAVAVHKTRHMLTLADGVLRQKLPIMFLVPKSRDYSYRKSGFDLNEKKEDRGAYMIGMGDMIMPAILVASAQMYAGGSGILSVFGISLPALGALLGGVAGLCLVLVPVTSGKPQPGLPYINTGAILGFLIACALTGSWAWLSF
jgi:presenilin-like A22 family membrane protease